MAPKAGVRNKSSSDAQELLKFIQENRGTLHTPTAQDELLTRFIEERQLDSDVTKLRKQLKDLFNRHRISTAKNFDQIFTVKAEEIIKEAYLLKLGLSNGPSKHEQDSASGDEPDDDADSDYRGKDRRSVKGKTATARGNGESTVAAKRRGKGLKNHSFTDPKILAGVDTALARRDPQEKSSEAGLASKEDQSTNDKLSDEETGRSYARLHNNPTRRKANVPPSNRSALDSVGGSREAFHEVEPFGGRIIDDPVDSFVSKKRAHNDADGAEASRPLKRPRSNADLEGRTEQQDTQEVAAKTPTNVISAEGAARTKKRLHHDIVETQPDESQKRQKTDSRGMNGADVARDSLGAPEQPAIASKATVADGAGHLSPAHSPVNPPIRATQAAAVAEAAKTGKPAATLSREQTTAAQQSQSSSQAIERDAEPSSQAARGAVSAKAAVSSENVWRNLKLHNPLISEEHDADLRKFRLQLKNDMSRLAADARRLVHQYFEDRNLDLDIPGHFCYTSRHNLSEDETNLTALYEQILGPQWRLKWAQIQGQPSAGKYGGLWLLKSLIAAGIFRLGLGNANIRWDVADRVRQALGEDFDFLEQAYDGEASLSGMLNDATFRSLKGDGNEKRAADVAVRLALELVGTLGPHLRGYNSGSSGPGMLDIQALEEMLAKALLIKAKIDAYDKCEGTLEFFWPKNGDKLDARTMDNGFNDASGDQKVQLTFWPGVKLTRNNRVIILYEAQVSSNLSASLGLRQQ